MAFKLQTHVTDWRLKMDFSVYLHSLASSKNLPVFLIFRCWEMHFGNLIEKWRFDPLQTNICGLLLKHFSKTVRLSNRQQNWNFFAKYEAIIFGNSCHLKCDSKLKILNHKTPNTPVFKLGVYFNKSLFFLPQLIQKNETG